MTITNIDPKPWEREGVRSDFLRMQSGWVRSPRPEFDVGDNPILQAVSDFEFPADELASLDLARGGDDRWFWLSQGATAEQIEHARAVLELIKKERNA